MTSPAKPAYKRILLKLSGEALMGEQTYGIDPAVATQIAKDIAEIQGMGVETAIVIGGGNIFRGVAASARGMDRAATSGGACRARLAVWIAPAPTTWACSPP